MSRVPGASWLTERHQCGSPRTGLVAQLPTEGSLLPALGAEVGPGAVADDMWPSPPREAPPASSRVKR